MNRRTMLKIAAAAPVVALSAAQSVECGNCGTFDVPVTAVRVGQFVDVDAETRKQAPT